MLQRQKFKIALYVVIFAIILTVLGFWVYIASAQGRDYQRLADLKVIQNVLADYYSKNGSYQLPNCDIGETISQCLRMTNNGRVINNINDPINVGVYRYVIGNLNLDDFEINFTFEAGIGGLSRGTYVFTKNGIRR